MNNEVNVVENEVFEEVLDGYTVIGLGNTGTNIIKAIAHRYDLRDLKLFAIDSVTSNISLDDVNRITYIPIISDEKSGSGRVRERGAAMCSYHKDLGDFDKMWDVISGSKSPVIVISSSAGGTGSGSMPVICEHIINELDKHVIPIIVIPSKDDPVAYHLNTSDLLLELDNAGVETYGMFRNVSGERNYDPINEEIVDFIEIILGKRYHATTSDSIDESDIDQLLKTPGRVMAVSAKANEINTLIRKLTKNMFAGFQPAWTDEEADNITFMSAYSLRSMFAKTDFKRVFDDVRHRVKSVFDEYSHIEEDDNDGNLEATAIIAGLPRPSINDVNTEFNQAESIASGMKKAVRPSFMSRKSKNTFNVPNAKKSKINWDKH